MTAMTVTFAGKCRPDFNSRILFASGRRRRGGPPPGFGRSERGFGGPFFGGRKAGRGDIRAAILVLLGEEPMHGYQIIQELSERSGGVWRPSPGSVYPTLQQLEDEGLVEPVQSEAGRRVFQLTDAGREQAAEQPAAAPWEERVDEVGAELVELRNLVFQVMGATRQVAQAGTSGQVAAAQEVLRTTRKSLYRLLAEDDVTDESGDAG